MSEYQYYEFAAVDKPLDAQEMAQLRAVSTRAEITPSGFVNHYEWGDLKANPSDWMQRYFDAFVYIAHWGSCRLALRMPLSTFEAAELTHFATQDALNISASETHWIFEWSLDEGDYDRFIEDSGEGWMRRLLPLRDELMRGDLRPLYLGWLAAAMTGELDDDEEEPEVPPGLAELSPAQMSLCEFMEVEPDFLTAAKAGSAPVLEVDSAQGDRLAAWLAEWSREDMLGVLTLIAQDRAQQAERLVKTRAAAWRKSQRPQPVAITPRRSLGELSEIAGQAAVLREKQEAAELARQEAERRLEKEKALRLLMRDVDQRWAAIEAQAQHATGSGYGQAVKDLRELAEGYALTSSRATFDEALQRWLVPHMKRAALVRRLKEAGLWRG